jgi:hypothetical protein
MATSSRPGPQVPIWERGDPGQRPRSRPCAATTSCGRRSPSPTPTAWLELLAGAVGRSPSASSPDETWAALGVLSGFLIGAVRREIADRRSGRASDGEFEWRARMAPYLSRMLDTGRFPALRDLIVHRAERDPAGAFDAELAIVLAGLNTSSPR